MHMYIYNIYIYICVHAYNGILYYKSDMTFYLISLSLSYDLLLVIVYQWFGTKKYHLGDPWSIRVDLHIITNLISSPHYLNLTFTQCHIALKLPSNADFPNHTSCATFDSVVMLSFQPTLSSHVTVLQCFFYPHFFLSVATLANISWPRPQYPQSSNWL